MEIESSENSSLPRSERETTLPQAHQALKARVSGVSATEIALASVDQLMRLDPSLTISEARQLHTLASNEAVIAARQFRERQLVSAVRSAQPDHGSRALVDGPNFTHLFAPSWAANALPGSIEARTSPVAYLADLYSYVMNLQRQAADAGFADDIVTIDQRRPDFKNLWLDEAAVNQVVPTLSLVNEALEAGIRRHLGEGPGDPSAEDHRVDRALIEARYPFDLPFHRYQAQVNHVLGRKQLTLGDVIRVMDGGYPYFPKGGLHSLRSDLAMQQDACLSPAQQALLTEKPYFDPDTRDQPRTPAAPSVITDPRTGRIVDAQARQETFYRRHYGVESAAPLHTVPEFCIRTKLKPTDLDGLLSIQTRSVIASANAPDDAPVTSPAAYGARFINAGQEPPIGIQTDESGEQYNFTYLSDDRLDRMQRLIRLARWLELDFEQTDRLLMAILKAEGQPPSTCWPSVNTLRALGLFRRLQRKHKVKAEDFAAFIGDIAVHAQGVDIPQFDRIFNDQALFANPLVLDGAAFEIYPSNNTTFERIDHLCSALGLTFEEYGYLGRLIAQSHQRETLNWDLATVSAFYRLTRLPALLGLSALELIATLELLDNRGRQYINRLAGTPNIAVHRHTAMSDTLNVIQALIDMADWTRSQELSVSWLYQHLTPHSPAPAATQTDYELLREIRQRLDAALLSQNSFSDVRVVAHNGETLTIDWMQELELFIDTEGLVDASGDDSQFEYQLSERIKIVLRDHQAPPEPALGQVKGIVTGAQIAQKVLLLECLASDVASTTEHCDALLTWVEYTPYAFLLDVLKVWPELNSANPIPIDDQVLIVLRKLRICAAVATQFKLSAELLRSYLANPRWYGQEKPYLTLPVLYALARYSEIVRIARQPESKLLDYFYLINTVDLGTGHNLELIREDAARKVAEFLGWGIRDVLENAAPLNEYGIVFDLADLDLLVRQRALCAELPTGVHALLACAELAPQSSEDDYRLAAQALLAALQATDHSNDDQGELGQSRMSFITVRYPGEQDHLVAGKGDKAELTIHLRNLRNLPLVGIDVSKMFSELGDLQVSQPVTDDEGIASATLTAGSEMGLTTVSLVYGLDNHLMAPPILIDADEHTLRLIEPQVQPMEALAGNLGRITYQVKLKDDFGNPGSDRFIHWGTDLGQFLPSGEITDGNGVSTRTLRSLDSGAATVIAGYATRQTTFDTVQFIDQPYFHSIAFASIVVAGQPARVRCKVVKLNGEPQPDVEVQWSATVGALSPLDSKRKRKATPTATSTTNAEGIAEIQLLCEEPHEGVVVTAQADDMSNISTTATAVLKPVLIAEHGPHQQDFVLGQATMSEFWVQLDEEVAAYPVNWEAGDGEHTTTSTNRQGRAYWSKRWYAEHEGQQQVSASVPAADVPVIFQIEVMQRYRFNSIGFVGSVVPGVARKVQCQVVKESGDPKPGVEVHWSADFGTVLLPDTTTTNAQGIAEVLWIGESEGTVVITATAADIESIETPPTQIVPMPAPGISIPAFIWVNEPFNIGLSLGVEAEGIKIYYFLDKYNITGHVVTNANGSASRTFTFDRLDYLTISCYSELAPDSITSKRFLVDISPHK